MKVLKIQDDKGKYINDKGERFNIIACKWVQGERAAEFTEFATLKHALEYYGLTDPNAFIKSIEEEIDKNEVELVEDTQLSYDTQVTQDGEVLEVVSTNEESQEGEEQ